jgi:hypothetical protein
LKGITAKAHQAWASFFLSFLFMLCPVSAFSQPEPLVEVKPAASPTSSSSDASIYEEATLSPLLNLPEASSLEQLDPKTVLSRLALAKLLVNWFAIPTHSVSSFPVFVDVPLSDPDYAALDTVRRYHLMFADDDGLFHPASPATRLDLWLAIAKVVKPKNTIKNSEAEALVSGYEGGESIPSFHRKRIAALFLDQILTEKDDLPLAAGQVLTTADLSHILSNLKQSQVYLKAKEKEAVLTVLPEAVLPEKVALGITPSQVISSDRLETGTVVYFQTLSAVKLDDGTALPEGSSLHGSVVSAEPDKFLFTLRFDNLRSALDGRKYKCNALLALKLKPSVGQLSTLLVTGQKLEVLTLPVGE